jgi:hypothetical protein
MKLNYHTKLLLPVYNHFDVIYFILYHLFIFKNLNIIYNCV